MVLNRVEVCRSCVQQRLGSVVGVQLNLSEIPPLCRQLEVPRGIPRDTQFVAPCRAGRTAGLAVETSAVISPKALERLGGQRVQQSADQVERHRTRIGDAPIGEILVIVGLKVPTLRAERPRVLVELDHVTSGTIVDLVAYRITIDERTELSLCLR